MPIPGVVLMLIQIVLLRAQVALQPLKIDFYSINKLDCMYDPAH